MPCPPSEPPVEGEPGAAQRERPSRRDLVQRVADLAMAGGLVAGYGTAGAIAVRYLYPARGREMAWVFVCSLDRLALGQALAFTTPVGERVAVARSGAGDSAADFLALSSTCPHLGCQVHWQAAQERFFCPCHNGVFAPDGTALEGPPAEAGTDLVRYPLRVEGASLFLLAPVEGLG